mmetsp:Transcript_1456/g.3218  ORF Transcript_1456/g.3218 Transcript_1456/m.3218 type:complete len:143 (-) Transcript_1456:44-472(-)
MAWFVPTLKPLRVKSCRSNTLSYKIFASRFMSSLTVAIATLIFKQQTVLLRKNWAHRALPEQPLRRKTTVAFARVRDRLQHILFETDRSIIGYDGNNQKTNQPTTPDIFHKLYRTAFGVYIKLLERSLYNTIPRTRTIQTKL